MSSSQNLKVAKVYAPELQKETITAFSVQDLLREQETGILGQKVLELTTVPIRNVP